MTDKPLAELLRGIEDDGVYGEWDDFREMVRRFRLLDELTVDDEHCATMDADEAFQCLLRVRRILDGGSG